MEPLVGIIIGSDSDLGVMSKTAEILDKLEIPYEFSIISAHRTPDRMYEYARQARKRGLKAIIAGAGGAAHVPGMVAAMTTVPVIGVPIQAKHLTAWMHSSLSARCLRESRLPQLPLTVL